MIKKETYLISAHNQWNLLKKLINSLDYEQNDICSYREEKST